MPYAPLVLVRISSYANKGPHTCLGPINFEFDRMTAMGASCGAPLVFALFPRCPPACMHAHCLHCMKRSILLYPDSLSRMSPAITLLRELVCTSPLPCSAANACSIVPHTHPFRRV